MKSSSSKIITSSALSTKEIIPIKLIVKGLLPEGLTILAAPPKMGKSFLALNLSIAVSSGKRFLEYYPTIKRKVLYLSLEDSEARLQDRINTITSSLNIEPPEDLYIITESEKFNSNNLTRLEDYINDVKAELVIIDTYAAGFSRRETSHNIYYVDDDSMRPIKKLAQKLKVSMIIIHHTNKEESGKGLAKVSGSYGMTGAADTVWVLTEDKRYFKLEVQGKDIETRSLQLDFDKETFIWSDKGINPSFYMTPEQKQIYDLLKKENREMKASEIARAVNKKDSTVSELLKKMNGIYIENTKYGVYRIIPETTESTESYDFDDILLS